MNSKLIRTAALRYQRSYGFTVEALHTLCCTSGGLKERLKKIDLEFFTLNIAELPESKNLRAKYHQLYELVTSKDARYPHEGRVSATLDQLHHTKLKAAAQLVWNFHKEFLAFMQQDAENAD